MSINVKLYGNLREKTTDVDERTETIGLVDLETDKVQSVADVLDELGLDKSKVSHVFVDNEYSSLKKTVNEADEVAIFPTDMGLLYHWYFEEEG